MCRTYTRRNYSKFTSRAYWNLSLSSIYISRSPHKYPKGTPVSLKRCLNDIRMSMGMSHEHEPVAYVHVFKQPDRAVHSALFTTTAQRNPYVTIALSTILYDSRRLPRSIQTWRPSPKFWKCTVRFLQCFPTSRTYCTMTNIPSFPFKKVFHRFSQSLPPVLIEKIFVSAR